MTITGGTGVDTVSFRAFAGYESNELKVYLHDDGSADEIIFKGHVGGRNNGSSADKEGQVEIHDFDPSEDKITFEYTNTINGLGTKLEASDFKTFSLIDFDGDGDLDDILVETKDSLGAGRPPVKFHIVGDYANADDFAFTVVGDDLILA